MLFLALFMTTSVTALASTQQRQVSNSPAAAPLQQAPSGDSKLKWDPLSKTVTVVTTFTGLQPGSNLAEHIHNGTCAAEGPVIYPLQNVMVDSMGMATVTSTVPNVSGGIPSTGWAIMVHNGPTGQESPLLCGEVTSQGTTAGTATLTPTTMMH